MTQSTDNQAKESGHFGNCMRSLITKHQHRATVALSRFEEQISKGDKSAQDQYFIKIRNWFIKAHIEQVATYKRSGEDHFNCVLLVQQDRYSSKIELL